VCHATPWPLYRRERNPVPVLQEAVGGLQLRSVRVRKTSPPPIGIRTVISACDSLLRLNYPGPHPSTQNNPEVFFSLTLWFSPYNLWSCQWCNQPYTQNLIAFHLCSVCNGNIWTAGRFAIFEPDDARGPSLSKLLSEPWCTLPWRIEEPCTSCYKTIGRQEGAAGSSITYGTDLLTSQKCCCLVCSRYSNWLHAGRSGVWIPFSDKRFPLLRYVFTGCSQNLKPGVTFHPVTFHPVTFHPVTFHPCYIPPCHIPPFCMDWLIPVLKVTVCWNCKELHLEC
jgi:hypothetical protein